MKAMAIAVKHITVMEYLPQVKTKVFLPSLAVKCPLVGLGCSVFLVIILFFIKVSINRTRDTDAGSKSNYS
jgi:hypothetical protein